MAQTDEEKKAYHRAYREAHEEKLNAYSKAYYEANEEEKKAYHRAYCEAHEEKLNAYSKAYYEANEEEKKEHFRAQYRKFYYKHRERNKARIQAQHYKYAYGMSVEELDRRREDQDGCCAICLKPTETLCVDHCHTTNTVRGLLCYHCNVLLGHAFDDTQLLQSAIKYLDASK